MASYLELFYNYHIVAIFKVKKKNLHRLLESEHFVEVGVVCTNFMEKTFSLECFELYNISVEPWGKAKA